MLHVNVSPVRLKQIDEKSAGSYKHTTEQLICVKYDCD